MRNRIPSIDRRTFTLSLGALGASAALPASAAPSARAEHMDRGAHAERDRRGDRGAHAHRAPIIISGASGHLGELTVRDLLARGIPARELILVTRTPEQLQSYAAQGATVRYGDFTKPQSLRGAFAGGRQMLLISIGFGPMPRPVAHRNAIDAAKADGVEHIAYTSWIGLTRGDRTGLGADHYQTEQILKQSGVAWTMLRNSIYMQVLLPQAQKMVAAGRTEVPAHEDRLGYVAREDCAAAAAAVLATAGHDEKAYDITGPQLLGPREIAETASAVTGRPIRIETAPERAGAPRPAYGGPAVAVVSEAVARLTGHPATSLKTFFERHRAELLGGHG